MNQHHSSQAGQQDAAIDVTDPWRGLYSAERLSAPSEYGETFHPDIPCWPDDREDALDKLVHAQGFDFQIVAGEFTEEAVEDGDELYWHEMRAWNPEAPEGEWRLAWKGDTEDGPYAWFVRPMALRPDLEAAPPANAVDLGPMREALQAAARSLRTIADSTNETELLETASEIRAYANSRAICAEQAVTKSRANGDG